MIPGRTADPRGNSPAARLRAPAAVLVLTAAIALSGGLHLHRATERSRAFAAAAPRMERLIAALPPATSPGDDHPIMAALESLVKRLGAETALREITPLEPSDSGGPTPVRLSLQEISPATALRLLGQLERPASGLTLLRWTLQRRYDLAGRFDLTVVVLPR